MFHHVCLNNKHSQRKIGLGKENQRKFVDMIPQSSCHSGPNETCRRFRRLARCFDYCKTGLPDMPCNNVSKINKNGEYYSPDQISLLPPFVSQPGIVVFNWYHHHLRKVDHRSIGDGSIVCKLTIAHYPMVE
jgi:hypothetical protein